MNAPSVAVARKLAADGTARRLRLDACLSLDDLARDLKVGKGTVSRWERGKRVPRGEVAARYAVLLAELMQVVGNGDGS